MFQVIHLHTCHSVNAHICEAKVTGMGCWSGQKTSWAKEETGEAQCIFISARLYKYICVYIYILDVGGEGG